MGQSLSGENLFNVLIGTEERCSKIFSVSLTISLLLSHVNPLLLTEIDKLYMWQTVQTTKAGEEAITHHH